MDELVMINESEDKLQLRSSSHPESDGPGKPTSLYKADTPSQTWDELLQKWPKAEKLWQQLASLPQQEDVLAHFGLIPTLLEKLATSGQTRLFCFLVSALRQLGADLWCQQGNLVHVGRTEHPAKCAAGIILKVKIAHPQLQIGQNFPQNMTDWQALTPETVAWALSMVKGKHLKPVSNRLPFWPDQYEPPEKLPIPLKKKALQQGYLEVLKLSQKYFPAEFMGDAHQPARQHFTLLLPNEQSVQTTIRTDLARMDQHFAELFSSEQLVENNRAVITQVESGVYKLEFARGDTTPWPDFAGNELSLSPRNLNNTMPLNQILYGPPGTGKTYRTIYKALAILEPTLLEKPGVKWDDLKTAFDKYQQAGQVAFVTFHQSFSYEDFVEGIRAVTSGEALEYKVEAGVFAKLCEEANCGERKPFVLIIDEINRGNVSRIFGELITLIEPSKRAGASEALSTTLPYSKQLFSVPDNLYLIGTMNTADRSLAGLDIALRRRFVFEEMPPRPDLFDGVDVEGVNIGALLRVMNQRIEVLLDRDHCLGHAYFMPLKAEPTLARLAATFQHQILPLLQEYFFEDWQHIAWVLNDHRKATVDQFLQAPQVDVSALFGAQVPVGNHRQRWTLNESAFARIRAYSGIIKVVAKGGPAESATTAEPEPALEEEQVAP